MTDDDQTLQNLRQSQHAQPMPPIDEVRLFLQSYVSDSNGTDVLVDELRRAIAHNPQKVSQTATSLRQLLDDKLPEGVLSDLVAVDANKRLDDPSDAGARAWLEELWALVTAELSKLN